MNILHTASRIWKHTGGPAEVIPLLCRYLALSGNTVSIATLAGDLSDAALACGQHGVSLHTFPATFRQRPWYSTSMKAGIRRLVGDADIIHGNGMWEYTNWCTGSEAIRQNKPYIISFHGSIMYFQKNWGLRHKIFWKCLGGRYVRNAACLHACTEEELSSIRSARLSNPVAVVPNGVEIWSALSREKANELIPEFAGKKSLLFLSRIHPRKGIFDLVNAWCLLENLPEHWQLLIAGPGQPEHVAELRRLIKSQKRDSRVLYLGPLFNERRIAAYQSCDVFVCPSYSENFGVVVGEALVNGRPVIATHGVPWPALVVKKCGWWVPNTVMALQKAICEAMAISDNQRQAMGQRGKELVLNNYTWPTVARKMLKTYEWVLGGGQAPSWVDTV